MPGFSPRTVVVTGAAGFLGNAVCRALLDQGVTVRAFLMPDDPAPALAGLNLQRVSGDVTNPDDLDRLLAGLGPQDAVIHAASLVSIAWAATDELRTVNVGGTAQVIEACRRHGLGRLLYVSSVHAFPEPAPGDLVTEIDHFEPRGRIGGYAQTKAEATELVLEAGRGGLDVVVVHPTGLIGPGDPRPGAQTAMLLDLISGRLTAYVPGGHDYADVRDTAQGVVSALQRGRSGECYLLTGEYLTMAELFAVVCLAAGRKPVTRQIPAWVLAPFAVLAEPFYARRGRWPALTRYALHALQVDARYSHDKASRELGYAPRDPRDSLRDAVAWLSAGGFSGDRPERAGELTSQVAFEGVNQLGP